MATDPRDEEIPLLNSERLESQTRIETTHFPWLQFSIFFALETAGFLTLNTQHPFIPDACLFHHLTFPFNDHWVSHSANSKYRDNGGREKCGILRRFVGACSGPDIEFSLS